MSATSGPPGTVLTIRGSGFVTSEVTDIELGAPVATTTLSPAGGNYPGSFLTGVRITDTEITGVIASGAPVGVDAVVLYFTGDYFAIPGGVSFTVQ